MVAAGLDLALQPSLTGFPTVTTGGIRNGQSNSSQPWLHAAKSLGELPERCCSQPPASS